MTMLKNRTHSFDENVYNFFSLKNNNMSAFIRGLMDAEKTRLTTTETPTIVYEDAYDKPIELVIAEHKAKSEIAYINMTEEKRKKDKQNSEDEYERLRRLYVGLIESGLKKEDQSVQEVLNKMRKLN